MSRPRLSVVVATRDRPALLDGCLRSLEVALACMDELIVVDSASRDAQVTATIANRRGGRYVRCAVPGASRARNIGWRTASSELIAFVDDDVRVDPGWADAVAEALTEHGEIGFVTGRIQEPERALPTERPVAVFDESRPFAITRLTPDPMGHGANHAIRRSALERIGGFDEQMGPGAKFLAAEDVDLWDRLLCSGIQGRYEPRVRSWHEQWRGRRDNICLDWGYGYGGGARLAKLLRSDLMRAGMVARTLFWSWGVAMIPKELRYRQPYKALLHLTRMSGVIAGLLSGLLVPVEQGHLSPRTRRHWGTRG